MTSHVRLMADILIHPEMNDEHFVVHRAYSAADILERFRWFMGPQHEHEFVRLFDEWISSNDYRKVAVIVMCEEFFPLEPSNEGIERLQTIANHWPSLSPHCRRWTDRIREQMVPPTESPLEPNLS